MDKSVRDQLQKATQDARALLSTEFSEQLEGIYDILPDGRIPEAPGEHLDAAGRVLRRKLIAAIEHKEAGGMKPAEAVQAFLREAAFTTLNRFVALKMLEARGLVQECVSRGEQSTGFKEFTMLAPGLADLPDKGYRLYIESLFDEIGREVRVLFDRRDIAGQLWPRRQALLDLLAILNQQELAPAWEDEEAIGWVYQYFNSKEERREMRAESSAPRNSYELAVRNQFFTPDYVVRFLVDNTLGRTWYEMRQGDTRLTDEIDYFARREGEVFLGRDETPPQETEEGALYVPFRAKKDPRDLKVLDPACGSGHFLLYAFDVLETIYAEAWQDEDVPASEATGTRLRDDYATEDALRRAVPGLILAHNLFGVDIDERAAQIAGLALWMRAQQAYEAASVPRAERPGIRKTNVVTAEPMPGEDELREEFVASLEPAALRPLVEQVFEQMKLAGETGMLLRIEEVIREAVNAARLERTAPDLFEQGERTDEAFWETAEERVYEALAAYAEQGAAEEQLRRRLFAEDATRGFAFIDLCRQRYDVVLMNPPFGRATPDVYEWMRSGRYGTTYTDMYASFVSRGLDLLGREGMVGVISSRSFLLTKKMAKWRRSELLHRVRILADLGLGVMDDAYVESCAYIITRQRRHDLLAIDAEALEPKSSLASLLTDQMREDGDDIFEVSHDTFESLPNAQFLYAIPQRIAELLKSDSVLEPKIATVRQGMGTFNDTRFVRLRWEVPPSEIGLSQTWEPYAKGGAFARFYSDIHLVVKWNEKGEELKAVNMSRNGQTAQVRQASDYWRRPGATYSKRSAKGFSARALPAGCVIAGKGPAVLSQSDVDPTYLVGWLNSRLIRSAIHAQANFSEYNTGIVKRLPWDSQYETVASLQNQTRTAIHTVQVTASRWSETNTCFSMPPLGDSVESGLTLARGLLQDRDNIVADTLAALDEGVDKIYGVKSARFAAMVGVEDDEATSSDDDSDESDDVATVEPDTYAHILASYAVGCAFGRWDVRYAIGAQEMPELPDPLDALPVCPPGMLVDSKGLPVLSLPEGYPLPFPTDGILVDDPGHERDIIMRLHRVFDRIYGNSAAVEAEIEATLGSNSRGYFRKSTGFFEAHRKQYSKSRRKAPIYWPLSTASGSYTVWLYYPRLTRDTFYRVLDVVKDKVAHEERALRDLKQEAGPAPSAGQRKAIADQDDFVAELRQFQQEVERVAPLWRPNLNDGVIINFAPLHRLASLNRSWQRDLEKTWKKLVKGEYDWSHLAMHLWPERVVPQCAERRDLAIAHGLEDVFWQQDADGDWAAREEPTRSIEDLIAERKSPTVKAALESLVSAR